MSATTDETEPVDAIKDLLEKQDSTAWTNQDPVIEYTFETPFAERGPGDGQPPELYVWQPVDANLEKLTADGRYLDETPTVEVQIWTLQEDECLEYQRDVIQIFGEYLDTQQGVTPYITFEPSSARDYRSDHLPRKTNHYLSTVEIDARRLSTTGL